MSPRQRRNLDLAASASMPLGSDFEAVFSDQPTPEELTGMAIARASVSSALELMPDVDGYEDCDQ